MTLDGKDETPGKTPRDERKKTPQHHRSRSRHHRGSPSHSPNAGDDPWLQDLLVGCDVGARLILGQLRRRLRSPGYRDHVSAALVDGLAEDADKWPQVAAEISSRHSSRPDCEMAKMAAEMATPVFAKLSRCLRSPAFRSRMTGGVADALQFVSGLLGPEDDGDGHDDSEDSDDSDEVFRDDDDELDYVKLGVSQLMKRPVKVVSASSCVSGQKCGFCHKYFVPGDQVKRLPCLHELHLPCLIAVLRRKAVHRSRSCPTCQHDLKD